jgi:tRNA dimethylallyltransferase
MMILVIVGPTASGKTALAEELAGRRESRGAEIISADSRQIYKRLSVGTAKPRGSWDTRNGVRLYYSDGAGYHLVDFLAPDKHFSAGDFVAAAGGALNGMKKRGKNAIVCGGTGFYVRSLLDGIPELPPKNPEVRESLAEYGVAHGHTSLHELLKKLDPAAAERIHPNNVRRVIRALEVFEITGKPFSRFCGSGKKRGGILPRVLRRAVDIIIIGIGLPRQELYDRINRRTAEMLGGGMIEETRELLKDYPEDVPALGGVGYDRVVSYLKGKIGKEELFEKAAQDTRHYAKRQMTWFSADKRIRWLDASDRTTERFAKEALKLWKS